MPKSTTLPAAGTAAPRNSTRLADARSLRSQTALKLALLRLIEQKMFDKITLREITAEAGLSYPTFFNHYDSKEDLFNSIIREIIVDLLQKGFRHGILLDDWRPGEGICAHIAEHRSLWRTLLTTGAKDVMRAEFIRYGREMPRTNDELGHGFPIDVVSGIVASGTFEIIAWWLAQETYYPADRVADMLETLVIEPALDQPPGYFTNKRRAVDRREIG